MMQSRSVHVSDIVPPFSLSLFVGLYASYRFPELVDVVRDGRYYRVLYTESLQPVLVVVEAAGTIDAPALNLTVYSKNSLSGEDLDHIQNKIRWMLGLDEDLREFYAHVEEHDPILSQFTKRLRGLRAPATPTVFEAVIHALVEQQISFNFAGKVKSRLVQKFGDAMEVEGETYYAFPKPDRLSRTTPQELRTLQLSRRKGEYIVGVASKVASGEFDFEALKFQPNQTVVEEISKLRGLGKWTAEMVMVRGMRKLDAIPADDVALRRLISHYYFNDAKVSNEQARDLAEERWGRYRGYAAFYLMYGGRVENFLK